MAVKNIKSLAHFIAACSEIKVKDDHTLFYRGHASDAYTPLPTIFRNQNDDPKKSRYVENEGELFHNLVTQCPEEFKDCVSTFDFLVKMQHYGLPTRLLDITSNPLVALYFSCCTLIPETSRDTNAKNGQVLIYQVPNDEIKYFNSDTVSVVSNLARAEANFDISNPEDRAKQGLYPDLLEKAIIESQDAHNEIAMKLLVEDDIAEQFSSNVFNQLKQRAVDLV